MGFWKGNWYTRIRFDFQIQRRIQDWRRIWIHNSNPILGFQFPVQVHTSLTTCLSRYVFKCPGTQRVFKKKGLPLIYFFLAAVEVPYHFWGAFTQMHPILITRENPSGGSWRSAVGGSPIENNERLPPPAPNHGHSHVIDHEVSIQPWMQAVFFQGQSLACDRYIYLPHNLCLISCSKRTERH